MQGGKGEVGGGGGCRDGIGRGNDIESHHKEAARKDTHGIFEFQLTSISLSLSL